MSSLTKNFLACDLGAESGRVILGKWTGNTVALDPLHRFPTGATEVRGSLRWDILRFFDEIGRGIAAAAARREPVAGLSVDAWGVDYAYFGAIDPLIGLPFHYRDSRTDVSYPAFVKKAGVQRIFAETGVQFMQINTLYQLYDDVLNRRALTDLAKGFTGIANYFHFLLTGNVVIERSQASTTQIYNPVQRNWSEVLVNELGLRRDLFPQIIDSGTKLGTLDLRLVERLGASAFPIYATCSHDTGAAVAAVPASGQNWAFLSSGTWSLLGIERANPLISDASLQHNYTNELGYGGRIRFLRNILGLWLLQEMRRELVLCGTEVDYKQLMELASTGTPFRSLIYPNEPEFLKPDRMIEKVQDFCRRTEQPAPESPAELSRCILESLALSYGDQIYQLEGIADTHIEVLHVVGGGSQNQLLNQFTANAAQRRVLAGPVEATALGNILIQAIAAGELGSLEDVREVIRRSFPIEEFTPAASGEWAEALERYRNLVSYENPLR